MLIALQTFLSISLNFLFRAKANISTVLDITHENVFRRFSKI